MKASTNFVIIHLEDEEKIPIDDYLVCIKINQDEYYIDLDDIKYSDENVKVYGSLEEYIKEIWEDDTGCKILSIERM